MWGYWERDGFAPAFELECLHHGRGHCPAGPWDFRGVVPFVTNGSLGSRRGGGLEVSSVWWWVEKKERGGETEWFYTFIDQLNSLSHTTRGLTVPRLYISHVRSPRQNSQKKERKRPSNDGHFHCSRVTIRVSPFPEACFVKRTSLSLFSSACLTRCAYCTRATPGSSHTQTPATIK